MGEKVLDEIVVSRVNKNEAVTIKCDNAPTEYKSKYAFETMQNFPTNSVWSFFKFMVLAGYEKSFIDSARTLVANLF